MTPEEFEKQFEELLKAAPKGSTLFCTYSNDENKHPMILFAHGKPVQIIFDLTQFARKEDESKRILTTAAMAIKIC